MLSFDSINLIMRQIVFFRRLLDVKIQDERAQSSETNKNASGKSRRISGTMTLRLQLLVRMLS